MAEADCTLGRTADALRTVDEILAMPEVDANVLASPIALVRAAIASGTGGRATAETEARSALSSAAAPYERLHALRTLRHLGVSTQDEDREGDGIEQSLGIADLPLLIAAHRLV